MSRSGPALAAPEPAHERLGRAGARVARLGMMTWATSRRLRLLRGAAGGDGARERALVLRDVARRALELHGIALEATGPVPLGPALLVSNHVSWLDPLVVASLVPCVPISKLDLAGWPVVGGLARELGVVFVARGDARSGLRVLRGAEAALAQGLPVLNFPEGTTTTGDRVLPFRKGLFGVARAAGVPVVPLAIRYDPPGLAWVGEDAFLPHWLGLAATRRSRAQVRLGAALAVDPGAGAPELARAAHAAVVALLAEEP